STKNMQLGCGSQACGKVTDAHETAHPIYHERATNSSLLGIHRPTPKSGVIVAKHQPIICIVGVFSYDDLIRRGWRGGIGRTNHRQKSTANSRSKSNGYAVAAGI